MNRRRIRANDNLYNNQFNYADNYIKTSKYSLITFLPLNLLEQFRRLANTYFLCLLILQWIPAISPLNPITTLIPLIVVLAITAIKDAHDDICRHKSDNQINNRLSELLRDGRLVREPWYKVKVGDIIRIENDQFVAADLMILSTSEKNGFCYVETAELDGETNLKCRQSLIETAALADNIDALASFDGEIVCETPNNNLTKFEGTLFWKDEKYPIDNDKMLLRGCVLRNTKWCFGLVVFAGKDTKLMQNSGKTIFKRTKSDRLLNILIMGIVLALITMCLFASIACGVWEMMTGRHASKYIPRDRGSNDSNRDDNFTGITIKSIFAFLSYLILLNTVVPISLYVSVEVIRQCQSLLIDFDKKMYYKPKEAYAKARTTTLNEELGQVEYVFSDKTGTLTQNLMTFNKCSINGVLYGEVKDFATGNMVDINGDNEHLFTQIDFSKHNPKYYEKKFKFFDTNLLDQVNQGNSKVHEFFTLLALCHTVMSELKNDQLEYQAQSPDEAALSGAARNFGFVFKDRTSNTIEIEILGKSLTYELLAILDFNNVRKRMSVIVRDPNGKISLYCKGADSVIFEHLAKCNNNSNSNNNATKIRELTNDHLEHFAGVGLRTLCLAKKDLSEEEYSKWRIEYQLAETSLEDRDAKKDRCYEQIEQDLELLGATAIEDKLQDNVPQTIANLMAANIKVWVLTGDKLETAINIGYSCELLNDDMCEIFVIDGCYPEEVEKQLKRSQKQIGKMLRKRQFTNTNKDQLNKEFDISLNDDDDEPKWIINQAKQRKKAASRVSSSSRKVRPSSSAYHHDTPTTPRKSRKGRASRMSQISSPSISPSKPMKARGGKSKRAPIETVSSNSINHQDLNNNNNNNNNQDNNNNNNQATTIYTIDLPEERRSATFSQRATPNPTQLGGGDPSGGFALVISGHSLAHALCPNREQLFLSVASQCKSVICCRVTPLQKALVVDLVKRHKKVITLSIGDGANDVPMLKMAHIGVGISGQEGMQAVLASDFSVAQFCYLERLLLVHGRWSYFRMCKFLRYFFYKNFSFTLCNLWYAFFCGFSAQTLFDQFFISFYNVCYTSLPVLAIGIFDQDVDDRFSTRYPLLYTPGHIDLLFNKYEFLKSVAQGIITSFTTFFITYGTFMEAIDSEGINLDDHEVFGTVVSTNLVVVVTAQAALDTSYWTVFNHIVIWGSIAFFFAMTLLFNSPKIRVQYYGVFKKVLSTPAFWFSLFLTLVILLVPVVAYRFYKFDLAPTLADRCRFIQRISRRRTKPIEIQLRRRSSYRKSRRSIRSGYAFSHQEGFGNLITSGMIIKSSVTDGSS